MRKIPLKSRIREYIRIPLLMREWKTSINSIAGSSKQATLKKASSFLIVPCDQSTILGSRGDEAMMVAMVQSIYSNNPDARIALLTHKAFSHPVLSKYNIDVISEWSNPKWSLQKILDICIRFDSLMIVGADTMDGHYSILNSCRLWIVADLVSRLNRTSTILGCSFNSTPPPVIVKVIRNLSPKLNILIRDPVSHGRFESFSRRKATLVSDAAFQLKASEEIPQMGGYISWVDEKRRSNLTVIGFNVHPMLFDMSDPGVRTKFILDCANAVKLILSDGSVAIAFISHDFRSSSETDLELLKEIFNTVRVDHGNLVYMDPHPYRATELKYIAGCLDALFSARMHLCIAALGMRKPVGVLTYQGKFEGLFSYFNLPKSLLINPRSPTLEKDIYLSLSKLVTDLSELSATVNASWNHVSSLSSLNTKTVMAIEVE